MSIRPVFSGQSLASGTGTVTIDEWQDGPRAVSYSFPKVTLDTARQFLDDAVGLVRPNPVAGRVTIDAELLKESRAFTPPAFWQDGESKAPGPLLWVSRAVVDELRATKRSTIRLVPLENGLRMTGNPAAGPDTLTLSVVATPTVALQVNGKLVSFHAIKLEDDHGGSYTLLDAPDNPLIVRHRFSSDTVVAKKKLTAAANGGYDVVALRFKGDEPTSSTRP
jgi:hypothetical protein